MSNSINLSQLVNTVNSQLTSNNTAKINSLFSTGDSPIASLSSIQATEMQAIASQFASASNAFPSMLPEAITNSMPGLSTGFGGLGGLGVDSLSNTINNTVSGMLNNISPTTDISQIMNTSGLGSDLGSDVEETFFVTITSQINPSRFVKFNVMPVVSESRTVTYQTMSPVHMPGNYQVYENTQSRNFSISDVKLISRNSTEASINLDILKTLRGWTMPYFGVDSDREIKEYFGAPPEPLYLSAYSTEKNRGHIYKVSVVLSSLDITYPNDCDYISTADGTPMPIIMPITSLTLVETHSAYEYEQFDLAKYRTGQMTYF